MPEPSRLVLLEQLPRLARHEPGIKVRFLACVHTYEASKAQLVLRDRRASSSRSRLLPAFVNIENVLETLSHELLEVGAWINVIGTLRRPEEDGPKLESSKRGRKAIYCPVVDATMIWSAGAVKLEEYRAAVEAYQKPLVTDATASNG